MTEVLGFSDFKFYEIRSMESLRLNKGVRKRTITCEQESHFHCFLWVDQFEQIHQIQVLFDEKVVGWNYRTGIKTGYTNRHQNDTTGSPLHVGVAKGSRTIEENKDAQLLSDVIKVFQEGNFPGGIGMELAECFKFNDGMPLVEQQKRIDAKKESDGFHPYVKLLPCAVFSLIGAADGHIDEKEWAILECYASDEFPIKSTLLKLVFQEIRNETGYLEECRGQFAKESVEKTLSAIRKYISLISRALTKQAVIDLKKDLFLMALNTARASGGMLGMYKISKEEKEQLEKLADLFQMSDLFEKMLSKSE